MSLIKQLSPSWKAGYSKLLREGKCVVCSKALNGTLFACSWKCYSGISEVFRPAMFELAVQVESEWVLYENSFQVNSVSGVKRPVVIRDLLSNVPSRSYEKIRAADPRCRDADEEASTSQRSPYSLEGEASMAEQANSYVKSLEEHVRDLEEHVRVAGNQLEVAKDFISRFSVFIGGLNVQDLARSDQRQILEFVREAGRLLGAETGEFRRIVGEVAAKIRKEYLATKSKIQSAGVDR